MLNFIHEARAENSNICRYVSFIDWYEYLFFKQIDNFLLLDAVNWATAELLIALSMKLRYAVEVEYFLDRSRSRLTDAVSIIESIVKLLWDSTIDLTDDSFDDSIDDSISERTLDESDNSSLLSAWSSFW